MSDTFIEHIVSKHWTPQHVDVTNAPVNFAAPRGSWLIEGKDIRKYLAHEADRTRRRTEGKNVSAFYELPTLPPVTVEVQQPRDVKEKVSQLLERVFQSRRRLAS